MSFVCCEIPQESALTFSVCEESCHAGCWVRIGTVSSLVRELEDSAGRGISTLNAGFSFNIKYIKVLSPCAGVKETSGSDMRDHKGSIYCWLLPIDSVDIFFISSFCRRGENNLAVSTSLNACINLMKDLIRLNVTTFTISL